MTKRVLLVEDDPGIATVVTEALREEGYATEACESIERRDALLASRTYDVMLTDIMLKDGDGLATIDAVQGGRSGYAGYRPFRSEHARYGHPGERHRRVRIFPQAVRPR